MLSLESRRFFSKFAFVFIKRFALVCYVTNHLMTGSLRNSELKAHGSAGRRISSVPSSNPVFGQVLSRYLYPPRYLNRY